MMKAILPISIEVAAIQINSNLLLLDLYMLLGQLGEPFYNKLFSCIRKGTGSLHS